MYESSLAGRAIGLGCEGERNGILVRVLVVHANTEEILAASHRRLFRVVWRSRRPYQGNCYRSLRLYFVLNPIVSSKSSNIGFLV